MTQKNPLTVGTPRWVKVSAIIALVLLALVVVLVVSGHDVGRHTGAGSIRGHLVVSPALTQNEP